MRSRILLRWSQLTWLFWLGSGVASPLFDEDGIIEIELRGPLGEIQRDTRERAERPFELVVDDATIPVLVRVRGKSRVVHCSFPPLRLRFTDADGTVFAGQGTLKLVTHCNKAQAHEINVLEEYAAFRLMERLTDAALRVRLLRIRYVDTGRVGAQPTERLGFVIEPTGSLAGRLGGRVVELGGISPSRLVRPHIASVFVAQYLIGNSDWSLVTGKGEDVCCHNGILIEVGHDLLYVPYDFDLSSLVDAGYAKQQGGSGTRRARQRRYGGYCLDELDLHAAVQRVVEAREAVFAEIKAIETISGEDLGKATHYLEGFFREAENPARLVTRFERTCIG